MGATPTPTPTPCRLKKKTKLVPTLFFPLFQQMKILKKITHSTRREINPFDPNLLKELFLVRLSHI
jgi:hypothetical protein